MVELSKHKVGLADVEEFSLDLGDKWRAEVRSKGKVEWKVVRAAMNSKMVDARRNEKTLKREQNILRKKVYKKTGDDSRKSKKIIRILKNAARSKKMELKIKYKKKVEHLKKKYRQDEEDKLDEIPNGLEGLEGLSIFDRDKFDKIELKEIKIETRGDLNLTENQRKILGLHPKFSVVQKLPKDALDLDIELANAKLRIQLKKDQDEKLEDEEEIKLTEAEQEKLDEMEAECRQIFKESAVQLILRSVVVSHYQNH